MVFHWWASSLSVRSVTEVISGSLTFIINNLCCFRHHWQVCMLSHWGKVWTSISPITGNLSLFAVSSATCGYGSSHEVLTSYEDHKWFTEFYIQDNCRTFRRLLRPEARVSIRYDTEQIVITGLRRHFGSCVNQPAFACYRSRPLWNFTFRFSMCPFPWQFGDVRFVLAPRCPLSFTQIRYQRCISE